MNSETYLPPGVSDKKPFRFGPIGIKYLSEGAHGKGII